MRTSARPRYAGYRFPAEIISHAVWLYFRFPLGLRMVEELLAARGIIVSHETVRQWALKFGQQDRRCEALVVASRGPDRHRSRCSGATPTRDGRLRCHRGTA